MRRREFITLLGGAAATWPFSARAQQGRTPTIGFLGTSSATAWRSYVTAFEGRLSDLGWTEGRTVHIEYRWAEGRSERFSEIASEFVRLNVNVIVTSGAAIPAVKQATSVIPIVFALANDPLHTGLVANLARPGSNVTGLSLQAADLAGKRLELLREIIPNFRRLAILANNAYPAAVLEMKEAQTAAHGFGIEVTDLQIRLTEDIPPAIDSVKGRADVVYVCADPLVNAQRARINALTLVARLPTMYPASEYVEDGGLISYGPNITTMFRRTAELVDRLLHGGKPGDIPVEQPTKFELVINLKTAKALGLTVRSTLLTTADEVIE